MCEMGVERREEHKDSSPQRILEAGHYYQAKGPTAWTNMGWNILSQLAEPNDARLLFVDDVHPVTAMHHKEQHLDVTEFVPSPTPTHVLTESSVLEDAYSALEQLRNLPRRKRARVSGSSKILRCSGHSLISGDGSPLCLFYDLGLTWRKRELGFSLGINILPAPYELEQRRLLKIIRKAMPDFELQVVLYDLDGLWWHLDHPEEKYRIDYLETAAQ